MATKRTGKAVVLPEAVTPEVVAAELVSSEPETLVFRVGIDQMGIDTDNDKLLRNRLEYEVKVTKMAGKPLDIGKIAGNMARQIWAAISNFSGRSKGYNMVFTIDNQLFADYSVKMNGSIRFNKPENVAHGILRLLVTQFDTSSAESLITGETENSDEVKLLNHKLGISGNLPIEHYLPLYELHRKQVVKKNAEAIKKAFEGMAPELAAKRQENARIAREKAAAKKELAN